MAYRLRKLNPPFGTETAPLMEYTYSEQVKVVDGICEVQNPDARDYLLKMGYEEFNGKLSPHPNGDSGPVPAHAALPKKKPASHLKRKKRRGRS